jgi:hypothetical protein
MQLNIPLLMRYAQSQGYIIVQGNQFPLQSNIFPQLVTLYISKYFQNYQGPNSTYTEAVIQTTNSLLDLSLRRN